MSKFPLLLSILFLGACSNTPPSSVPTDSNQAQLQSAQTAEVVVYTSQMCGFCQKAKDMLAAKNIKYKEIDVAGDTKAINEMEKLTGKRTVPQILVNGKHIGSYKDLVLEDMFGSLDNTLKGVS